MLKDNLKYKPELSPWTLKAVKRHQKFCYLQSTTFKDFLALEAVEAAKSLKRLRVWLERGSSVSDDMRSKPPTTLSVLPDMVRFSCLENLLCQVELFIAHQNVVDALCVAPAARKANVHFKKV